MLLVGVTVWNTYDTSRQLDSLKDFTCIQADLIVTNELLTLAIFATQEGVNEEAAKGALDVYNRVVTGLEKECEIPLPVLTSDELKDVLIDPLEVFSD